MNFSIAIIARNESKTLPRLLESLSGFQKRGGEIVLVDTGSSDGTPELARQAGCRVHEAGERFLITLDSPTAALLNETFVAAGEDPIVHPGDRSFDFASARNFAASLASHDFVAMPDCDEIYTSLNLDAVCALVDDPTLDQIDSIYVFSRDQYGRDAITFSRSRFYRRSRLHWDGLQHESLRGVDQPRRILAGESILRIEHWQNPETKRGQYLTGLALDCHRHPANARHSHYLGRELFYARRPRSAIRELERHIAMQDWPSGRAQSHLYIGESWALLGDEQQQLDAYWRAIQTDATRRAPFLRLAGYWFQKGDAQRTACFAAAALQIPWNPHYADDRSDYTTRPHELLSWAKWRLGDIAGARQHWQHALAFDPQHPRLLADARHFIATPAVAVLLIVGEEDPGVAAARIEANALYPDFEVIAGEQDPGPPQPLAEVLGQMLPLVSASHVLFLEADYEPGPGFLMQAVIAAQQHGPEADGVVLLHDKQDPDAAACWLAPKARLLAALEGGTPHTRSITDLLPGAPCLRADLASVERNQNGVTMVP